jgi:hypothetical protein
MFRTKPVVSSTHEETAATARKLLQKDPAFMQTLNRKERREFELMAANALATLALYDLLCERHDRPAM